MLLVFTRWYRRNTKVKLTWEPSYTIRSFPHPVFVTKLKPWWPASVAVVPAMLNPGEKMWKKRNNQILKHFHRSRKYWKRWMLFEPFWVEITWQIHFSNFWLNILHSSHCLLECQENKKCSTIQQHIIGISTPDQLVVDGFSWMIETSDWILTSLT